MARATDLDLPAGTNAAGRLRRSLFDACSTVGLTVKVAAPGVIDVIGERTTRRVGSDQVPDVAAPTVAAPINDLRLEDLPRPSACALGHPMLSSRPTDVSRPRLPLVSGGDWRWSLLLVLAVLLAYGPVWKAGFVWDDLEYITANPCMVGWHGLKQIWTTSAADISPLTLTTFWVEHALWGLAPLPYHLVNVALHGACAVLLWRVLRNLQVPGAWLGAAVWALHPVQVESVAWVSETKNPQSGLFFLLSVLFFLRWMETKDLAWQAGKAWNYGLTLIFAALAMASKSSTVVLPVVLCLCAWWTVGRWSWRSAMSVGPIFLLSIAASALSIWTQALALSAAHDPQWVRTYPERLATAGDAVWFYLGRLAWPYPLMTNYPRWKIDAGAWFSYLPVLAVPLVLFVLWRKRQSWSRPWFFVFVYLLTALLPVLGLFDNPIFRFSLVFDHFQYLASMGPLALAGAGMARLAHLTLSGRAWCSCALGGGMLLLLAASSWQRSELYRDDQTFWTDTVTRNPDDWLGRSNLASALLEQGREAEAQVQFEKTLATNPNYGVAHDNLGVLFLRQGKIEQAIAHIERAVAVDPGNFEAHSNLGNAFLAQGQADEAIDQYEKALAINPGYKFVYFNLGNARFAKGQIDEAVAQYEKALALQPDYAEAHCNLGNALLAKRQINEAIAHYEKALASNANYADAHNNLGIALMRMARFDEAVIQFQEVLRLAPGYPNGQQNLSAAQRLAQRARLSR